MAQLRLMLKAAEEAARDSQAALREELHLIRKDDELCRTELAETHAKFTVRSHYPAPSHFLQISVRPACQLLKPHYYGGRVSSAPWQSWGCRPSMGLTRGTW